MGKLIGIILCATIPLLTFVGCGEDKSPATSQSSSTSSISEDLNLEASIPIEEATEKTYRITGFSTPGGFSSSTSFSDGYAWISFEELEDNEEELTACINKSGEIQFFTDENIDDLGEWQDGTCKIKNKIINTNNETIFETDEEFTKILAYGDGYYAIAKYEHNIDSRKYFIYFLDTSGNWFDTSYDLNLQNLPDVTYLGENIFGVGNVYINLNTKQATEITDYHCKSIRGKFNNGVAIDTSSWVNGSLIYSDGSVKSLDLNRGIVQGPVSDGGFVYSNTDDNKNTHLYFYDINTETSLEITSYKEGVEIKNSDNLYFEDGYLFLSLKGVDGLNYITFFDKSGNEVTEPVAHEHIGMLSSNRIITYDLNWNNDIKKYDKRIYTIYDGKGNFVFETNQYEYEIALEKTHGSKIIENCYQENCIQVDKYGYLDADGNLLFDKLTHGNIIYKISK